MRIKSILTAGLALIATTLAGSPPAHADDFLWLGLNPSGGWVDQSNWLNLDDPFLGGYPNGPNHDARFTTRGTVRITSGMAVPGCDVVHNLIVASGTHLVFSDCLIITGRLTIENGGSLTIDCGGTVELAANNMSHRIGGSIFLACSTSILRISGNATLDPHTPPGQDPNFGKVRGQHNDAAIRICKDKTLTNNITICGMMTIQSATCSNTTTSPSGRATSPPRLRPKVQTQPRASGAGDNAP